jgi:hypothetical protein
MHARSLKWLNDAKEYSGTPVLVMDRVCIELGFMNHDDIVCSRGMGQPVSVSSGEGEPSPGQRPSSPAVHNLISRPHSDFRTCEAARRRLGLGSRIE